MMSKMPVYFLCLFPFLLNAQTDSLHYYNDTSSLYTNQTIMLPAVTVLGMEFNSLQDWADFRRMQFAVNKVYPYYTDAINLIEEADYVLYGHEKKRQKRKYLRKEKSSLKGEYKKELKALTVTQGYILVKMIERKTGLTLYDIIKKYQSAATAASWNMLAKINGYSLKEAYDPEEIKYLELILQSME